MLRSEIGPDWRVEPVGHRRAASPVKWGQIWKSFLQMSVFQMLNTLQLSPVMDLTHLDLLTLVHQTEKNKQMLVFFFGAAIIANILCLLNYDLTGREWLHSVMKWFHDYIHGCRQAWVWTPRIMGFHQHTWGRTCYWIAFVSISGWWRSQIRVRWRYLGEAVDLVLQHCVARGHQRQFNISALTE